MANANDNVDDNAVDNINDNDADDDDVNDVDNVNQGDIMYVGIKIFKEFKFIRPIVLSASKTFDAVYRDALDDCMGNLLDGDDEDLKDRYKNKPIPQWPCSTVPKQPIPLPKTEKEFEALLPPNGYVIYFNYDNSEIEWFDGSCMHYRIEETSMII